MNKLLGSKADCTYIDDFIGDEKPDINIVNHGGTCVYNANKEAMDKIKALSDKDFEKEISKFSEDTQMFMRLAREHNNEA